MSNSNERRSSVRPASVHTVVAQAMSRASTTREEHTLHRSTIVGIRINYTGSGDRLTPFPPCSLVTSDVTSLFGPVPTAPVSVTPARRPNSVQLQGRAPRGSHTSKKLH